MRKFKLLLLSLSFLFVMQSALAQSSPVDMLESTTNQMLTALKQTNSKDTKALYSLVQRILLPHVDMNAMSQQILGAYWKDATSDQKNQFKKEFSYFVTRTYSTALASYSNEKVRYFPIRGGVQGSKVQVNSAILQANGQSISVNYRLLKSGGQWKVYDFTVEGVSIVSNYKSQFSTTLRNQGVDGLIAQLRAHNQGM